MISANEDNLPFLCFSDIDSWERLHDYQNNKFYCERGLVLVKLVDNEPAFYAFLMEFRWAPSTEDHMPHVQTR